jgi:hypothetical protein
MLRDLLVSLVHEWGERPTLRTGVICIAGILWLYGLLVWYDAIVEQDRVLEQKAKQLARLESQAAETQWPERLQEAERRLLRFESSVKVVESLGQAQADLQDWVGEQARGVGLRNVTVSLSGAPSVGPLGGAQSPPAAAPSPKAAGGPEAALGLGWVVRAQVRSDFSPVAAYDMLSALSSGSRRSWIESISIQMQPSPRWEFQVVSAYRSPRTEPGK